MGDLAERIVYNNVKNTALFKNYMQKENRNTENANDDGKLTERK